FDLERIRYKRIVIMTDADVDGAHIRTLLLTLFYRYFRPIIDAGYLYIAQPPLYKISRGKMAEYAYSDDKKDEILKEWGVEPEDRQEDQQEDQDEDEAEGDVPKKRKASVNIQRYKGLGEMNPDQLWETTMDPERRKMLKVSIQDAERADLIFETL